MNDDIALALRVLSDNQLNSDEMGEGAWSFTNENLAYIKDHDLSAKNVLVTTASGDQVFDVALHEPKSITCFDKRALPEYWVELKRAAIMTMTEKDFEKKFVKSHAKKGYLARYHYQKMRELLSPKAQKFWDAVIGELNIKFFRGHLRYNSAYLQNKYFDNYKKLQGVLEQLDLKFVVEDYYNLPEKLKGQQFDAIFTSNIGNFTPPYEDFHSKLSTIIAPKGFAQINYDFEKEQATYMYKD